MAPQQAPRPGVVGAGMLVKIDDVEILGWFIQVLDGSLVVLSVPLEMNKRRSIQCLCFGGSCRVGTGCSPGRQADRLIS